MGSIGYFFCPSHWSILATTIDINTSPPRSAGCTSGTSELKTLSARPRAAPGKDVGAQGCRSYGAHTDCASADTDIVTKTPVGSRDPPGTAVPQRLRQLVFMGFSTACPGLEHPGTAAPRCWPAENAILGIETLLLPSCEGCQGSLFPLGL